MIVGSELDFTLQCDMTAKMLVGVVWICRARMGMMWPILDECGSLVTGLHKRLMGLFFLFNGDGPLSQVVETHAGHADGPRFLEVMEWN